MAMSFEEVADSTEIYDLYSRYVHPGDDLEMLDTVFLPDSIFNYSPEAGRDPITYNETQTEHFRQISLATPYKHHHCSSILVDFDDEARSSAHVKDVLFVRQTR
jgi:hypothetical protein